MTDPFPKSATGKTPASFDVAIIGAGAAGLMCAIEAGNRGRSVILLEHAEKVGKKILISGGGRCNFTNIHAAPDRYLSSNPHFIRSALSRYRPTDFLALVNKHKIAWHEKKLGQLFCDQSSRQIVAMLLSEAESANVQIKTNCNISSVTKSAEHFHIRSSLGEFKTTSLVIASGGLSIPKMGATPFAHEIARQFGLQITETRPGLVPLTLSRRDLATYRELSGISIDALVSFQKTTFRENILFTHRGLSGPAILQISTYWQEGKPIRIDLLPELSDRFLLHEIRSGMKTGNWLSQHLPRRFVEVWLDPEIAGLPGARLSKQQLETLHERIRRWELLPNGTEGYQKAEVTIGGVDTRSLSGKTMEATNTPGLYFIGEAVDVTGWLGGYNFQWAWASGWVAGQFV